MDEIHEAIQDAQFIGAMVDPTPRPSHPLCTVTNEEAEDIAAEMLTDDPDAFTFHRLMSQPLGYFMFCRYACACGQSEAVRFLDAVLAYRNISHAPMRTQRALIIAKQFLETPTLSLSVPPALLEWLQSHTTADLVSDLHLTAVTGVAVAPAELVAGCDVSDAGHGAAAGAGDARTDVFSERTALPPAGTTGDDAGADGDAGATVDGSVDAAASKGEGATTAAAGALDGAHGGSAVAAGAAASAHALMLKQQQMGALGSSLNSMRSRRSRRLESYPSLNSLMRSPALQQSPLLLQALVHVASRMSLAPVLRLLGDDVVVSPAMQPRKRTVSELPSPSALSLSPGAEGAEEEAERQEAKTSSPAAHDTPPAALPRAGTFGAQPQVAALPAAAVAAAAAAAAAPSACGTAQAKPPGAPSVTRSAGASGSGSTVTDGSGARQSPRSSRAVVPAPAPADEARAAAATREGAAPAAPAAAAAAAAAAVATGAARAEVRAASRPAAASPAAAFAAVDTEAPPAPALSSSLHSTASSRRRGLPPGVIPQGPDPLLHVQFLATGTGVTQAVRMEVMEQLRACTAGTLTVADAHGHKLVVRQPPPESAHPLLRVMGGALRRMSNDSSASAPMPRVRAPSDGAGEEEVSPAQQGVGASFLARVAAAEEAGPAGALVGSDISASGVALRPDAASPSPLRHVQPAPCPAAAPPVFAPAPADLFDRAALCVSAALRWRVWLSFCTSAEFRRLRALKALERVPVHEQHFSLFRTLGRGSFGTVNACRKRNTGALYARKMMNKRRVLQGHAHRNVWNERNLLARVDSPFILSIAYAYQTTDNVVLVTDVFTGGDLGFHLRREKRFSEARAKFYAAQLLLGLEHLHDRAIVYRDLKPSNVLLSQEGNACLTDLGMAARVPPGGIRGLCGTRGYWAPEMMQKTEKYGLVADWWSFGCLVYEMLAGVNPFRSSVPHNLTKEQRSALIDQATLEHTVVYPSRYFSPLAADLCAALLDRNPATRLGAKGAHGVRQHPWFRDIDWGRLASLQLDPPFKPEQDVNAMSQDMIGSFLDHKREPLTADEQHVFDGWEYVSPLAVQRELVQFMRWEEIRGAPIIPQPDEELCCGGTCCSVM